VALLADPSCPDQVRAALSARPLR